MKGSNAFPLANICDKLHRNPLDMCILSGFTLGHLFQKSHFNLLHFHFSCSKFYQNEMGQYRYLEPGGTAIIMNRPNWTKIGQTVKIKLSQECTVPVVTHQDFTCRNTKRLG